MAYVEDLARLPQGCPDLPCKPDLPRYFRTRRTTRLSWYHGAHGHQARPPSGAAGRGTAPEAPGRGTAPEALRRGDPASAPRGTRLCTWPGSAQFLDADQVARGIAEGAVAHA